MSSPCLEGRNVAGYLDIQLRLWRLAARGCWKLESLSELKCKQLCILGLGSGVEEGEPFKRGMCLRRLH